LTKILSLFFFCVTALYGQSPVDSLDIYDPFEQTEEVRRILNNYFSILGDENKARINKLEEEIRRAQSKKSLKDENAALIESGDIYFRVGLYNSALNKYFTALEKLKSTDTIQAAMIKVKIGRAFYFSDLSPINNYITEAYQTLKNSNDSELKALASYAKATIEEDSLKRKDLYQLALKLQLEVIKKKPRDKSANENLSRYLNANGKSKEALAVAEKNGSKWLQVLYLNNIGYDLFHKARYKEALTIFDKSLKICKDERLKTLLRNTYENIARVYRLMGSWKESLFYLQRMHLLEESLYTERYLIQASGYQIKYETQKKELENRLLKKEQTILHENITYKQNENYFLIIIIMGISLTTFLIFLSRKKIKTANALLDIQKNEIHDQKEILESLHLALKKSEKNLNIAQAATHMANWEWDLITDEISFSKELPNIFGVEEEQMHSNFKEIFLGKIHHAEREQFSRYFCKDNIEMQKEGKECRIITGENEKWVRLKRIIRKGGEGNVTRVFGTVHDITDSKKKEEARIQLASQQSFTKQLIASQEEERKRIAGDLHDNLGQDILLIKNRAQLGLQGENLDPFTIEQLTEINNSTSEMLNIVREISFNLRPAHLERLGLTETVISLISKVSDTTQINFSNNIDNIDNLLPDDAEINFFRIIQESISNIVKHSDSRNAEINIFIMEQQILVEIIDDGKGFELKKEIENAGGFGLKNIQNRVEILKGELIINSQNSMGTKLIIKIPLNVI